MKTMENESTHSYLNYDSDISTAKAEIGVISTCYDVPKKLDILKMVLVLKSTTSQR